MRVVQVQKEPPFCWAALEYFLSRCVLLHFHLRHPNRNLALNNKDRKNDDQNEAEQVCMHGLYQISLDYRRLAGKVKRKRFRIGSVSRKLTGQPLPSLETRVRTQHAQHQGILI